MSDLYLNMLHFMILWAFPSHSLNVARAQAWTRLACFEKGFLHQCVNIECRRCISYRSDACCQN